MAKKDRDEFMPEEIEVKEEVIPVPAAPVKRFTFEQWAVQKGLKEHHKAGMKAFCKNPNKLRTVEDWDKAFEGY
jgi:hypothetical protein